MEENQKRNREDERNRKRGRGVIEGKSEVRLGGENVAPRLKYRNARR